jgi:ABA responsive element binding factor
VGEGPNPIGNNMQRQGSLTLPRTLSQKKVDEVWRDLMKDSGNSGSSMPQRQPTLGEVTLEEFLVRAGVVKEDAPNHAQQIERPDNNKWFSDFSRSNNNTNLLPFQQPNGNNGNGDLSDNNNLVPKQIPIPPSSLNLNQSHRPPPLFPKPTNVAFTAAPIHLLNNAQLGNPGRSVVPAVGMFGLSAANVAAPVGSPGSKMSPDAITKRNIDPSLPSPVPYGVNRGRKCGAVEKVVERRQRRMIKNRESAARSRARKQVSISFIYAFLSI